ncbi:hypothetical protein [Taklimakanibacter albus]|uniref:Uncharacterized protein n=1 Tax=Taklimakanibacter albus TaxID=2800327 RepID=A0ACC5RCE2_9HYPH|nr:hypothetical protein [Aestuariivirga sp. YIM B02566]MBK1870320.1 hypothetical protein [Aestuariivirga sp. YIM B02566]
MSLNRLALCCAALIVFSGLHVAPASADLLGDIGTGVRKTGKAIERGAKKAGKAVKEGAEDAGEAIGRGARKLGRDLERGYCNLTSDRDCRVNARVGRDKQGPYTYDPKNPSKKYRGDETDPAQTDRDKQLSGFAAYVKNKDLTEAEIDDRDVHGFRRFLAPNAKLGVAYPDAQKALKAPTKSGEIRPCCQKGGGGPFLTDRLDKSKLFFAGGTEYLTKVDEPVYAPLTGWVEKEEDPRNNFAGLVLRDDKGYRATVSFLRLTPEIEQALKSNTRYTVKAGETVIGHAQDLHPAYPPEVPNHVYVTMSDPKGDLIDPAGKITLKRVPKSIPAKAPTTAAKP